jgi:molybdopterin-containing oxidoreductase family membrane subunit
MKNEGLIGVFKYLDDLVNALEVLRKQELKIQTVYSPVPSHEILETLGVKASPVRYFTLIGAMLGIATGVGLAIYTAMQWKFIVSGKPPVPRVPYVIVAFEFCILLGVFWNLASMWVKSRLPKFRVPPSYDPRFSRDRFGVVVLCSEPDREKVKGILTQAGAEEVHAANG